MVILIRKKEIGVNKQKRNSPQKCQSFAMDKKDFEARVCLSNAFHCHMTFRFHHSSFTTPQSI
jgi:hypothetical protein